MVRALIQMLERESRSKGGGKRAVDLGSGDGRIVIALARSGFEAHGFELNPLLVAYSRRKIRQAMLQDCAFIHQKSYWDENLSSFDVVVVFGISYIMKKLEKKLVQELRPGSLVASNYFSFPDWKPVHTEHNLLVYKKST
jgi:ribosomal protein L11 methylase PrmA